MLNLIRSLTRKQKAWVFLALDLALIPVALLFTYAVQTLPASPVESLLQSLPVLPYLLAIAAGLSIWLGLSNIQLKEFEGHDPGAPAFAAPCTGSDQPFVHPLADDVALHFRKSSLNLQESAPCRGCRVHRCIQRPECDSPCGQLVDESDQLTRKPPEPVEIKHDKHVVLAQKNPDRPKDRGARLSRRRHDPRISARIRPR